MEPSPPPSPPAVPAPGYRLHSPGSITWATFFGTPIACGVVLALNYWKWGQKTRGVGAVVGGVLVTAVLGWLAWIVPAGVPAFVFFVPQVVGGYVVAKSLQGRRFDAHVAAGGKKATNWIGAGIGLLFSVLIFGPVIVWYLVSGINPQSQIDYQRSVDFGHGQAVYYSRGATREDAQKVGEALVNEDYFDDSAPAEVLITGQTGAHQISFVGGEGVWDDESNVEWMRAFGERIAPAIGGKPLTVLLLDERFYVVKRLQIE